MYEVQFLATTSADWSEAIELIDANTNQPLTIPDDAEFELTIGGQCWSGLSGSSDDGRITRPKPNVIQWKFTTDDFRRYWPGRTHSVGITMTTSEGTIQILIGTLSIIDGVVR